MPTQKTGFYCSTARDEMSELGPPPGDSCARDNTEGRKKILILLVFNETFNLPNMRMSAPTFTKGYRVAGAYCCKNNERIDHIHDNCHFGFDIIMHWWVARWPNG